jgi:hypothetical protein
MWERGSFMTKNKGSRFEEESKGARISFNPKNFLAKVGDGKTVAEYQKDQIVFAQGTPPRRCFTFRKVGSSSPSFLSRARTQSSES